MHTFVNSSNTVMHYVLLLRTFFNFHWLSLCFDILFSNLSLLVLYSCLSWLFLHEFYLIHNNCIATLFLQLHIRQQSLLHLRVISLKNSHIRVCICTRVVNTIEIHYTNNHIIFCNSTLTFITKFAHMHMYQGIFVCPVLSLF